MKYIDLSNSKKYYLSSLTQEQVEKRYASEKKGWSISFVYHFTELRDIFLVLRDYPYNSSQKIYENIKKIKLNYVKTPWEERRILEQINALKNFGLIDTKNKPIKDVFKNSIMGTEITLEELNVFEQIYFSFFRFNELHSWFLFPKSKNRYLSIDLVSKTKLLEKSNILFPFFYKKRFTDAFLADIKNDADIFLVEENREDLMRFWDVYIKWGTQLGVLEKFNLKELDLKLSTGSKSLNCVYFKRKINGIDFNLLEYIKNNYNSRYIKIPNLIFNIIVEYRFSVEDIKRMIIQQVITNNQSLSLQRTSEIFIRNKGKFFFPKYKGSYISHILVI